MRKRIEEPIVVFTPKKGVKKQRPKTGGQNRVKWAETHQPNENLLGTNPTCNIRINSGKQRMNAKEN